jgi:uncharacterized protein YbjT (DUF2867 family)
MIIVTGATGALNGATVDHLLERVPAEEVVVAVRDTAKAGRFAETRAPYRPRSTAPTSCSWCRPATRVPTP